MEIDSQGEAEIKYVGYTREEVEAFESYKMSMMMMKKEERVNE